MVNHKTPVNWCQLLTIPVLSPVWHQFGTSWHQLAPLFSLPHRKKVSGALLEKLVPTTAKTKGRIIDERRR